MEGNFPTFGATWAQIDDKRFDPIQLLDSGDEDDVLDAVVENFTLDDEWDWGAEHSETNNDDPHPVPALQRRMARRARAGLRVQRHPHRPEGRHPGRRTHSRDRSNHPVVVTAGFMGTAQSIEQARKWLARASEGVDGDDADHPFCGYQPDGPSAWRPLISHGESMNRVRRVHFRLLRWRGAIRQSET